MSIFEINDIDNEFINVLMPYEKLKLYQCNKYYNNLLSKDSFIIEYNNYKKLYNSPLKYDCYHNRRVNMFKNPELFGELYYDIIYSGYHTNVLKCFISYYEPDITIFTYVLFRSALYYGTLDLAIWLYNRDKPEGLYWEGLFMDMIKQDDNHENCYKKIEWLYNICKINKINVDINCDGYYGRKYYSLKKAVERNNVKVVKWLYETSIKENKKYDDDTMNEILSNSFMCGRYDVFTYLYSIMNITQDDAKKIIRNDYRRIFKNEMSERELNDIEKYIGK